MSTGAPVSLASHTQSNHPSRRRRILLAAASAALAATLAPSTPASTVLWRDPGITGDFNTPANWAGAAIPGAADDARITNGGTATLTGSESATVLQLVLSDTQPSSSATALNNTSTAGNLLLSSDGSSSPSLSVVQMLNVGGNASRAGVGTFTLNGGSVTVGTGSGVTGGFEFNVGYGATSPNDPSVNSIGIVNQSAGTLTVNRNSYVGYGYGATGTWNLTGGSAAVNASGQSAQPFGLVIGSDHGTGTVYVSGANTTLNTGYLNIGRSGGTGLMVMQDGTLTANNTLKIGDGTGTGAFVLGGGTASVKISTGNIVIGGVSNTVNALLLVSGGRMTVDNNIILGNGSDPGHGPMVYTQTGGTVTALNFQVANNNNINCIATANLSGGSLSTNGSVSVGGVSSTQTAGSGTFNQTGGFLSLLVGSTSINVGNGASNTTAPTLSGSYNLSGGDIYLGNASLTGNALNVGFGRTTPSTTTGAFTPSGTFTQTGGRIIGPTADVYIGRGTSGILAASGIYNLSGGLLSSKTLRFYSGSDGITRQFNFTGGTLVPQSVYMPELVNDGGTLSPGAAGSAGFGSIGTTNLQLLNSVPTNYTQTAKGTLAVDVQDANTYDKLAGTTGSMITLGGTVIVNTVNNGTINVGDIMNVVTTGTPGLINNTITPTLVDVSPAPVTFKGTVNAPQTAYFLTAVAAPNFVPDADAAWSDPAAWTTAAAPNSVGAKAHLGKVLTASRTITLDLSPTLGVLNLDSADGTSGYTIAGPNTFSLTFDQPSAYAAINVLAGPHKIAVPVTLAKNLAVNAAAGSTLELSNAVSGPGGLTLTGPGSLLLSGSNSYAGSTTISSGTLRLAGGQAIPDSSPVSLADGAAAVLDLNGSSEKIGSLAGGAADKSGANAGSVLLGSGTLTVGGNNASTTFSGALLGSGSLVKTGSGTLTLLGANAYTGGTTIEAGSLAGNTNSIKGDVFDNANLTLSQDTLATFPGKISGSGSLTVTGYGTLTLTTANSYSGGTTVGTNSTLAGNTSSIQGNIASTGTVSFTQSADGNFSGVLSGTGSLRKDGPAVLKLTSPSTYTGPTSIDAGSIVAGIANALPNASTVTVASGASLDLNGFDVAIGGLAGQGSVLANGNLTVGGNNQHTVFAGAISGSGAVTKVGTGMLAVRNASSNAGGFTVQAGTLATSNASYLGGAAAPVTLDGGKLQYTGGLTSSRAISVTSAGGTLQVDGAGNTLTQNATLAGSGPLTLIGPGVVKLAAPGSALNSTVKLTAPAAAFAASLDVAAPARVNAVVATDPGVMLTLDNATLSLQPHAGNEVSKIAAANLTFTGTGVLDMSSRAVFTGMTSTDLLAKISATYAAGAWTGTGGISSSSAASQPHHATGIAWAQASDLGVSAWGNQSADPTDLVTKYTWYGDINMDGVVNADDYSLMDRAVAKALPAQWITGDFNYDGSVNSSDFLLMDTAFATQTGVLSPALLAQREAQFGPAYVAALTAAVPEPSLLAGLAVLGASLAARRRRRA